MYIQIVTKHSFQVHDIELWWSTIRILLELPSVTRIFQISIRMYKNLRDASDEVHCTASRTRLHHNKRNCLLYMAFPLKLVHDNIVVGIFILYYLRSLRAISRASLSVIPNPARLILLRFSLCFALGWAVMIIETLKWIIVSLKIGEKVYELWYITV